MVGAMVLSHEWPEDGGIFLCAEPTEYVLRERKGGKPAKCCGYSGPFTRNKIPVV